MPALLSKEENEQQNKKKKKRCAVRAFKIDGEIVLKWASV